MGLLLPLLGGCPGTLPEPASNYLGGGTGTGGSLGTGGAGGTGAGCDAPAMVFSNGTATACSNTGCHSQAAFAPLLSGTDAEVWARLLDKTPVLTTGNCAGGKLVDGANRAASVILTRVNGNTCGDMTLMPYATAAPDPAIVACLTSWINAHN